MDLAISNAEIEIGLRSGLTAVSEKPEVQIPRVSVMVNSALLELNDRKGSSLHAIKKYIVNKYEIDAEKSLRIRIKKYLKSAVAEGGIIQVSGTGASGSFKIMKKKRRSGENPTKLKAVKKDGSSKDSTSAGTSNPAAKLKKNLSSAASKTTNINKNGRSVKESHTKPKARKVTKQKPENVAKLKPEEVAKPKVDKVAKPKVEKVAKPKAEKIAKPKASKVTKPTAVKVAKPKTGTQTKTTKRPGEQKTKKTPKKKVQPKDKVSGEPSNSTRSLKTSKSNAVKETKGRNKLSKREIQVNKVDTGTSV